MMRIEQIEALMEQVGPVLDPLNLSYQQGQKAWGIQLDPETLLIADFDEPNGKLFLSCNLGAPPQGDRSKLYETLLIYNSQWHATGGGRLAVDGPAGNIVFAYDLSTANLELTRLVGSIRTFGEVVSSLKKIVTSPAAETRKVEVPTDGMMIRI